MKSINKQNSNQPTGMFGWIKRMAFIILALPFSYDDEPMKNDKKVKTNDKAKEQG